MAHPRRYSSSPTNTILLMHGGIPFGDGLRLVTIPPARISVMANLTSVLHQLEQERTRLSSQLESLTNALSALKGPSRNETRKSISTAGRARIAAAQRARWAKVKGKKVVSIISHKRTISPAGRRRIAAAQKARWAKVKRAKKAT